MQQDMFVDFQACASIRYDVSVKFWLLSFPQSSLVVCLSWFELSDFPVPGIDYNPTIWTVNLKR